MGFKFIVMFDNLFVLKIEFVKHQECDFYNTFIFYKVNTTNHFDFSC